MDMICTMRNWESRYRLPSFRHHSSLAKPDAQPDTRTIHIVEGDDHHCGPELLLTPAGEYLTPNHRDDSPVRRRGRSALAPSQSQPHAYSIPIADILVVETYNVRYGSPVHKLKITTISYGVFDFHCNNSNGHDILMAFLQASLPPERIVDGSVPDPMYPCISRTASSLSCMDVDRFTAQHVQGHVESETWPEKISRRVGKVVSSLQEISVSFCEVACCQSIPEQRERPPPHAGTIRYHSWGMDDEEPRIPSPTRKYKYPHLTASIPSGLSLESEDPELESVFERKML